MPLISSLSCLFPTGLGRGPVCRKVSEHRNRRPDPGMAEGGGIEPGKRVPCSDGRQLCLCAPDKLGGKGSADFHGSHQWK